MKRIAAILTACVLAVVVSGGMAYAYGSGFSDDFGVFDESRWSKGDHGLGRSHLDPANVDVKDSKLRLKLPARTTDGAEISSDSLYGHGSYEARIKVPRDESSITGFFLYYPPDRMSEVDVEIFNDRSRKVMFTYYSGGAKVSETAKLPFDPTRDFHDYRFDYGPNELKFYVDGKLAQTLRGDMPEAPQRLYVNAWYPNWLKGKPARGDRYVYVDRIRYEH